MGEFLFLEQIVKTFSRYQKYALGADLHAGARKALALVVRANSRRDKVPVLLELREKLEALKVLLRLSHDAKAFANFNSFQLVGLYLRPESQQRAEREAAEHLDVERDQLEHLSEVLGSAYAARERR